MQYASGHVLVNCSDDLFVAGDVPQIRIECDAPVSKNAILDGLQSIKNVEQVCTKFDENPTKFDGFSSN